MRGKSGVRLYKSTLLYRYEVPLYKRYTKNTHPDGRGREALAVSPCP